jgi:GT2 family glycosyltransferase
VVLSSLLADLGLSHSASRLRKGTKTDEDVSDQELTNLERDIDEPGSPFSSRLVLTPTSRRPTTLSEATVKAVLAADCSPIPSARYDVISFPGPNRNSDPQRSQRITDRLANQGYRMFCIELDACSSSDASQAFRMRTIAPNLFEARLTVARQPGTDSETIEPMGTILLEALETLRSTYGIDAAVAYVRLPSWGPLAMRARERWGWKVVYDLTHELENYPAIDRSPTQEERIAEREADLVVGLEAAFLERGSGSARTSVSQPRQSDYAECWQRLDKSIRAAFKRASIVIVTFDNLVYTKLCLRSLLANTEYPNYEVVVVDNGSTDGTPAYLRSLMRQHPHVRAVFNGDNLGFARANNQGLAAATGDVLVLLNNDTLVPRGWLMRLVRHLEDPDVGLIGPVTNRIGNEAQIDVSYHTYGEFAKFARCYSRTHEGQIFNMRTLMMFCVAMRREVYERVGVLDERYEVGTFEDDDYAMRVRSAGYRVARAEDVFVHHFGEATFGKLVPTGEYGRLLRANRRRLEEKWGIRWESHRHRLSEGYEELIHHIQQVVGGTLPPASTVVVVSKGDDELLRLDGRWAWHFPQSEDGVYAGQYPADDEEAIAHLESLRAKGAEFLLFPATAFWWLEHYEGFRRHLEGRYERVWNDEHCVIYKLSYLEPDGVEARVAEVVGSVDARVGYLGLPPGTERPGRSHEPLGGAN